MTSPNPSKVAQHYLQAATRPLIDSIQRGDRVTIIDRFGQQHSGKAVMRGPHGWVLNMGGPHGTPGIATDENTVKVVKGRGNRSAAIRTIHFYDDALDLRAKMHDMKRKAAEQLAKKAQDALQTYGVKVKGSIYDPFPRGAFLHFEMDVEVEEDMERHELESILDQVLDSGWTVESGSRGNWRISCEVEGYC